MTKTRGQSAVEFLISNGWAILIVIILLATLFYIGVLNPQQKQPNICAFSPGFSCYNFRVGNGTGSLELDFGQAIGKSIQVTGISCSPNESAAMQPLSPITIPSGEHRWIAGQDSNNSGIACEGATGEAGERYKGKVCVNYTESGTGTQRIICGEINARLEPAPTPTPAPSPGWLYGHVDNCSEDLEGANVTAGSKSNTSNASGQYIIYNVPPGNYTVTARKAGHATSTRTATVTSGNGTQLDFTVLRQVNISSCQTLDQCRYYLLTTSLSPGGDCMTITSGANGATLDCASHLINGSGGGYGIYLNPSTSGITVRDCRVSRFSEGIYTIYSSSNTFTGNSITSNGNGIHLIYSHGFTVSNNNATGNGNGIWLWDGTGTLAGNTASTNGGYGIIIQYSGPSTLTGNRACGNANDIYTNDIYCDGTDSAQTDGGGNICMPEGINFTCLAGVTCGTGCPILGPPACASGFIVNSCPCELNVPGNYSLTSDLNATGDCITFPYTGSGSNLTCNNHLINGSGGGTGIYLSSTSGITIENCNVSHFSEGINTIYSSSNTFTGNSITSNGNGIHLIYSHGFTVSNNNATGNGNGIWLWDGTGTLAGNNASSNGAYGIRIQYSGPSTLASNIACDNPPPGGTGNIYCDGTDSAQTDGAGNICEPDGINSTCLAGVTCSGCP